MARRLALVTGGMGALGEAISIKLADTGCEVAVTFSPANKNAEQWLADIRRRDYWLRAYSCDVADYDCCRACVAAINRDLGPVDILVNNAHIVRDASFREMTKGDWD